MRCSQCGQEMPEPPVVVEYPKYIAKHDKIVHSRGEEEALDAPPTEPKDTTFVPPPGAEVPPPPDAVPEPEFPPPPVAKPAAPAKPPVTLAAKPAAPAPAKP